MMVRNVQRDTQLENDYTHKSLGLGDNIFGAHSSFICNSIKRCEKTKRSLNCGRNKDVINLNLDVKSINENAMNSFKRGIPNLQGQTEIKCSHSNNLFTSVSKTYFLLLNVCVTIVACEHISFAF